MKRLRFAPKLRDRLLANNRADAGYARLYGKEPIAQAEIAPKREYKRNEGRVSESDVNDVVRQFSADHSGRLKLWRNNRGAVAMAGGALVTYGVGPNGASDFIGYREVTITQAMVGSVIAQFIAAESKAPDAGPPGDAQIRFIERINDAGGVAIVVRERKDLDQL
jgi:hypothetical protein